MRIIYIADDDKEFDDKFECEHYEMKQEQMEALQKLLIRLNYIKIVRL